MKTLTVLLFGAIAMFLSSCASNAKFPVSSITPAAEISAKMKHDKNKNSVIEVTASNLASADRLNPPKKNYVVWISTENNGTTNIGQLNNKNAKKSYLKTSTPFKVKEIFITAEDQGDMSYPSGIEITRTRFK
ncbi:MAG: hypothetical protein ABIV51_03145 [Saprospiraceae bacterium]